MPLAMKDSIERALRNIVKYGDTDIFPFPFERYTFDDSFDACVDLLMDRDNTFEDHLANHPPLTIESLTQIGYTGFRRATQIEPFWNAYYLALVISIAQEIENYRIPEHRQIVYSYRYVWSDGVHSLFGDSTWNDYRKRASERAGESHFVVLTDIADFYSRINHHRLQNALNRLINVGHVPYRIIELLKQFSQTRSYGIPIGGPASRMLAELSLADVDKHLDQRRISFCRFVDDYAIFSDSKADAYEALVFLSEKLSNEGLSLQRSKTKIVSSSEFSDLHLYLDPKKEEDPVATEEQKLLNVSIRYDPYSPTADEDYEGLREAVAQIDILGILSKEVGKTLIDQTVAKQAISALRVLDVPVQEKAMRVLLDSDNLLSLAPVFVSVMRAVRGIFDELSDSGRNFVDEALVELYENSSHLLRVELNLSYYIQAISRRHSVQKEQILGNIYERSDSHLLRRQVIRVMSDWTCHHWLSDKIRSFNTYTEWERRALLIGSYCLGDEGRHWRKYIKKTLSPTEKKIKHWAAKRREQKRSIPV